MKRLISQIGCNIYKSKVLTDKFLGSFFVVVVVVVVVGQTHAAYSVNLLILCRFLQIFS